MSTTNTTLEVIPTTIKAAKKRRVTTRPETGMQLIPDESTSTEDSIVHPSTVASTPSENQSLVLNTHQDPLEAAGIKKLEADIRQTHTRASRASIDVLVDTAKCGLMLQLGKKIAGHGNFEQWVSKRDFGFSKMTRSNYMRFADHISDIGKSKSLLLLNVELNKDGQLVSHSFNEEDLKVIVIEVSNGRSLMDLYVDWNITKSTPVQSGNSSTASAVADMYKRFMVSLDGLPTIFPNLKLDEKSFLIEKIESILTALKSSKPNEKAKQ